jgi:hypothetical protein
MQVMAMKEKNMKEVFNITIGIVIAIFVIVGFTWFYLWLNRPAAKYSEETRRQVWEESVSREQGVNHLIAGYCFNMRTVTDPAQKKAFARLILDQSGSFSGELTADSQACVSEAKGTL